MIGEWVCVCVRRPKINPPLPQPSSWLMDEGEEPFMYYYWREPGPWRERERERERGNSVNDNHRLVCKHVLCTLLAFQFCVKKVTGLRLSQLKSAPSLWHLFIMCLASPQICFNLTLVAQSCEMSNSGEVEESYAVLKPMAVIHRFLFCRLILQPRPWSLDVLDKLRYLTLKLWHLLVIFQHFLVFLLLV